MSYSLSYLSSIAEKVRKEYPEGTRVRCISMSDPYHPVPTGTEGTVINVDDIGTIHVNWDNGQSLGLAYGADQYEKV